VKARNRPEGRYSRAAQLDLSLACCDRETAEDWYSDILEAAEHDLDMALLLAQVEEHLRRAGGVATPPWWAR
jgi:hypothetical protein